MWRVEWMCWCVQQQQQFFDLCVSPYADCSCTTPCSKQYYNIQFVFIPYFEMVLKSAYKIEILCVSEWVCARARVFQAHININSALTHTDLSMIAQRPLRIWLKKKHIDAQATLYICTLLILLLYVLHRDNKIEKERKTEKVSDRTRGRSKDRD